MEFKKRNGGVNIIVRWNLGTDEPYCKIFKESELEKARKFVENLRNDADNIAIVHIHW
jgi:hypothetical protein